MRERRWTDSNGNRHQVCRRLLERQWDSNNATMKTLKAFRTVLNGSSVVPVSPIGLALLVPDFMRNNLSSTMTRLIATLVACCVAQAGCGMATATLGSRLPLEAIPDLPASWGAYAMPKPVENGCPVVAGEYRMEADVVEVIETSVQEFKSRASIYFNLFVGPLGGEDGDVRMGGSSRMLSIDQPDDDTLVLRAVAPDNVNEVSWHFSIESAGLICVDGFFQLPVEETTETVEGTWLNGQQFRRFTTLEDGSLIYYEQFGPLKRLVRKDRSFTHRFYRFRPMSMQNDSD